MRPRRNHSNINEIITRVRHFNRLELLAGISRLASRLDEEPGRAKQFTRHDRVGRFAYPRHIIVSTHSLAALTRVVLAHGNKWPHTTPSNEDVVLLENRMLNLPSFFTTEPLGSILPEQLFFQLAKQQFPFQTGADEYAFGRSIVLYKHIPPILASEGTPSPANLESAFEQITGMSIGQFMWSGFLVWAASKRGKAISLTSLTGLITEIKERWQGHNKDQPTLEGVRHFLDYVSMDFQGFAEKIGDLRKQDERLIAVDFQPLLQYPAVRAGNDEYMVPIPKLLIDRFTNGLFHDLANGMRGSGHTNSFRTYFGKLFERYVGLQLAMVFDPTQLNPEQNYGKEGKSTPDWVVNDPDMPLAIECRSSTFTLETQKYADLERIARDIGRIGVDTLFGIWPKIQDIQEGRTHIPLASEHTPLPVICTFESLEPIGMFGAILRSEIRQVPGAERPNFYLMPVHYLEAMCATENRDDFFRALMELEVDATWHDPSGEGPRNRWLRAMPEPMPKNRILVEATEGLWSAYSWPNAGANTAP